MIPPALLAALALTLTACAPRPPLPESFRDAGAGLYSNAVLDPARIAGDWVQVAAFMPPNAEACPPGKLRLTQTTDTTYQAEADLCLPSLPRGTTRFAGLAEMPVPGRITLSGADPDGLGQPWWIVWVDVDYRTMAIATPSGRFGFILNRDGRLPADRQTAAREVFDWGGYDLTKLRLLNP